jgi:uncharacterized protein YdaU (DUF1376 family)
MPVWISDFFTKTDHLSNKEQWAYLKLMMKTWARNCKPMPDSDHDIARLLDMSLKEWRRIRPRVALFFDLSESTWRQHHLEDVFRKVIDRNDSNASRGAAGGRGKSRKFKELALLQAELSTPPRIASKTKVKEEEDSVRAKSALTAAASASALDDSPPEDPLKAFWDRALDSLTAAGIPKARARPLVGRWRRDFGDTAVEGALCALDRELPSDPVSFMVACLNHAKANGNERGHKQTPGEKLFEGAYRAAKSFGERERVDRAADEPLLDC